MTSNERFPKGALTHHPRNRAVVSLPVVRLVRSPRGMRLLRKPMDNAGKLLSSTQATSAMLYRISFVTCLRKPAPGSFTADMGESFSRSPMFSFAKENQKFEERTLTNNGNLPSGREGNQPRYRTIRLCRSCLHELFRHPERL